MNQHSPWRISVAAMSPSHLLYQALDPRDKMLRRLKRLGSQGNIVLVSSGGDNQARKASHVLVDLCCSGVEGADDGLAMMALVGEEELGCLGSEGASSRRAEDQRLNKFLPFLN
jgi:hypothetical protein